ncbi:DUF3090 domain-containing protein [Kineococcus sp. SYSU DK001]|uniref:DUF3090 domain-containing protein n=1 Tax=Kineococcus sp. SYSU DK001 TaxID=3383122 RepID=UPI003D7EFA79
MPVYEYDPPERFVAGTVGEPGQRTFFLQARGAGRLTSVALEKTQVAALGERVGELLDEIVRRSGGAAPVPAVVAAGSEDTAPLDVPIEEEFRVGTMSLAWDSERQVVVIECFEVSEADTDPELEGELDPGLNLGGDRNVLRVSLDGTVARAFAARALALVAAGRPPCPFCAGPLDPAGHVCPRANGYRR